MTITLYLPAQFWLAAVVVALALALAAILYRNRNTKGNGR